VNNVQNQAVEKRPYVRPELAKLGNVEISTQDINNLSQLHAQ
jgi:hypothetical protein